jgi:8-oxo-dGTP pyrophosphatase MutT (NUDIX family)
MTSQQVCFSRVVQSGQIRIAVPSLCFCCRRLLVQWPADEPGSCFAFGGGEGEPGETFEERLRKEYVEELGIAIVAPNYLFVLENRFDFQQQLVSSFKHYFQATLNSPDVESAEEHLVIRWLAVDRSANYDGRPTVVRDAIVNGSWRSVRHVVAPCH